MKREIAQHTPTPWKYDAGTRQIISGNGDQEITIAYDVNARLGDVAFIVRAVNIFEEMANVLKIADEYLAMSSNSENEHPRKLIRAVIARAEGRE